jgi:hypothetical protein
MRSQKMFDKTNEWMKNVTYVPCMNRWGGGKHHINNVKFRGIIICECRALGEELWGAGV